MFKRILLVFTTNSEKFAKREELIRKYSGKEIKYSDFAFEVIDGENKTLYSFVTINADPMFSLLRELQRVKDETSCEEVSMDNIVEAVNTFSQNIIRFRDKINGIPKAIPTSSGNSVKGCIPPGANCVPNLPPVGTIGAPEELKTADKTESL